MQLQRILSLVNSLRQGFCSPIHGRLFVTLFEACAFIVVFGCYSTDMPKCGTLNVPPAALGLFQLKFSHDSPVETLAINLGKSITKWRTLSICVGKLHAALLSFVWLLHMSNTAPQLDWLPEVTLKDSDWNSGQVCSLKSLTHETLTRPSTDDTFLCYVLYLHMIGLLCHSVVL